MDMEIKISREQAEQIIADEIRRKLGSLVGADHKIVVSLPARYSADACKIEITEEPKAQEDAP